MLKKPRVITCCMVKTPLMLMRKSVTTPLFFMGLILLNYLVLSFVILPFYQSSCELWFYIDSGFIGTTLLLFMICSFKDPGYLKKPDNISFLSMLKNFDPVLLCPDCQIIRT